MKQALLSLLTGVMIAVLTFWLMMEWGLDKKIEDAWLNFAGLLKLNPNLSDTDLFRKLFQIAILLILIFFINGFFYAMALELAALIIFLFSSKRHKPKVFIAYKNYDKKFTANTTQIATEIEDNLKDKFIVHLFPKSTMHHDNINFQIKENLKKSQAIIAIPDPYETSYADTEIQAAYHADKPVFIIKHTTDQILPSTANSGHVVMILSELRKAEFRPLHKILLYTHNYWKERLFLFRIPLNGLISPIAQLLKEKKKPLDMGRMDKLGITAIVYILIMFVFIFFKLDFKTILIGIKAIVSLFGVYASYITLNMIFREVNTQQVIRQSIIDKKSTYNHLKNAGFDKETMSCIDKKGLILKK